MATDISKFFKEDPKTKSVTFIGDTLDIRIFDSYNKHGCLTIAGDVETLGIFDMVINGTINVGYCIAGKVTISPREISKDVDEEGNAYVVLHLKKGDIFLKRTEIVQQEKLAYVCFSVFVEFGQRYKFMTYDRMASLFNGIHAATGLKMPVDNAIFEMVFSHLARSHRDVMLPYRLTDMKEPPVVLSLTQVSHSAINTAAKLVGAYFGDGVNSALVHPAKTPGDIEVILRS